MSSKQPKSFYLIALLEIWERFGYYGVQAIIVVFMVKQLGYTDKYADILFTSFAALVFLLPALGGYIGDSYLGTKRTILFGAFTLAIGYGLLSLPEIGQNYLALPLAVIAVGNGLFKANPSSLLSKIYQREQRSADRGFTLYYMSVNIGSFLSMSSTPIISKHFGWHMGFLACFIE